MTREEEQRFCDEWERCCNECGLLYTLMRTTPVPLAIADDPDPWVAHYNQAVAERVAEGCESHQRITDHQRGVAVDAVSIFLAHVIDLVVTVKAMVPSTVDAANRTARKSRGQKKWEVARTLMLSRLKDETLPETSAMRQRQSTIPSPPPGSGPQIGFTKDAFWAVCGCRQAIPWQAVGGACFPSRRPYKALPHESPTRRT